VRGGALGLVRGLAAADRPLGANDARSGHAGVLAPGVCGVIVCPVCWGEVPRPRVGRPPVVHPGCRGAYEAELRRVRRRRNEAVEALDLAADALRGAGIPAAERAIQRAIRLVNEGDPFLSAKTRQRWWRERNPGEPGYASAVGSWSSSSGPSDV